MKYRLFNRIYSKLNGYFWLPCPLCGQFFGGHEWDDDNTIYKGKSGIGICRDCGTSIKRQKNDVQKNKSNQAQGNLLD